MIPLPIDTVMPAIVESLRATPRLVLKAPPGAGKTTRVPGAILDAGLVTAGREIWVLEPRRIAARMAAERVARERGGVLGDEVGYQMRFEERASSRTRIRFVTEGILTRRLLRDAELHGIGAVVLDEFHERSLEADLALGLLREAQAAFRPDLLLVVMSATLDAGPIAEYLASPVIESEGRVHPIEIEHEPARELSRIEAKVARGFQRLLRQSVSGSVLVFVPGAAEIRRSLDALAPLAEGGFDLRALHGDLSIEEQEAAIRAGARPRVIVSTNVAEASLTVEGVEAVIDTGLARVKRYDASRGLDRLHLERISRSSAAQRAGRAGRLGPGRCVRLYSAGELESWPEIAEPEVLRCDLAPAILNLFSWGERDPRRFGWLSPPSDEAIERGLDLLRALQAIDGTPPTMTEVGRAMLRFPTHPRYARILVEGERRGVGPEAAAIAALAGERDLRLDQRASFASRDVRSAETFASSDLWIALDLLREAEAQRFSPGVLSRLGVDGRVARRVTRAEAQFIRLLGRERRESKSTIGSSGPTSGARREEEAMRALLAGFPDRVVRRHAPGAATGLMVGGLGVRLAESSVVREDPLFLALDAEAAQDRGGRFVRVRTAALVRDAWLRELFPQAIREESTARFDPRAERVVALRRTLYHDLVLEEKETGQLDASLASATLSAAARANPERALSWTKEAENLRARVLSLQNWEPALELEPGAWLDAAIDLLSTDKRSFAELRNASLHDALLATLSPPVLRALDSLAPERVTLPSGRPARLEYRLDGAPILAARLQEFFGSDRTPSVNRGRVAVLLHLLAPSHRPLQVTSDLASFWRTVYPKVRGELRRKYPRHSWPDDPMSAKRESRPGGGRRTT